MTDERDIVERLRHDADGFRTVFTEGEFDGTIRLQFEAAADITRLRAELAAARNALSNWDALIKHQYSGSRQAMSDMQECAFETKDFLDAIKGTPNAD